MYYIYATVMWPSMWRWAVTCRSAPSTSTRARRPRTLRVHTRCAFISAESWSRSGVPSAWRTAATTIGATAGCEKASADSSTSLPPGQLREGCFAEVGCRRCGCFVALVALEWFPSSEFGAMGYDARGGGTQVSLRTTPAVSSQWLPLGQPVHTSLSTPHRSTPRMRRAKPPLAKLGPHEFFHVQYFMPVAWSVPQPMSSMQWPPTVGEPSVSLKIPCGYLLKKSSKFA
mmetsp:Transcript_53791/g.141863  ORF Transcript_53791/g.141863 Transcript_53791/m.141863 type:complete len:229 (+) Transcript_53791:338-1024(+)